MSASLVHLIRHGEVDNPHHVVYADLPGYGLTDRGRDQAAAVALRLADAPIARVISSPLLRAVETAAPIAAHHGLAVEHDERLTEWGGAMRWAGVVWESLDDVFPGELTAYLATPLDLSFGPESLLECGERVAATARSVASAMTGGELVVVSHQDPIHAGHRNLIGGTASGDYHEAKPAHAAIVTLRPRADGWEDAGYWEPDQGTKFPPAD